MPPRHELTDIQKSQIVALEPHYSHADISSQLNIPRTTITSFLQRTKRRQSTMNSSRSGRPRKLSQYSDRLVARIARSQTRVPLKELKVLANVDVSEQTIRRHLKEVGIQKWRAVKRPSLKKEHAKKRLEWAKAHRYWTVDDWNNVIWSDESAIQKDSNPAQVWVFRHQNKKEKYDPRNVQGKSRDGGVSQMIWGCFVGSCLGPIVFLDGAINQDVYMRMLDQHLVPFIEERNADGQVNLEFQQDNARPHTARRTKDFLEELIETHGLTLMEWPPNSPDMNPIEHLWAHLKLEPHRRFPDTVNLKGAPQTIKASLRPRLASVWHQIQAEVLQDLVNSMPRRVEALLKAKGWYTEY
jgi:transposase